MVRLSNTKCVFGLITMFAIQAHGAVVRVEVNVPINGRNDAAVRFEAKVQAKDQGIDRLPVVMVAHEQVHNDTFTERAEALAAGAAKVKLLSERFDRLGNNYHLIADVELDENLSLKLLAEIKSGQDAKSELAKLKTSLASAPERAASKVTGTNWLAELRQSGIKPMHFQMADSKTNTEAAYKYAVQVSARVLGAQLNAYSKQITVAVLSNQELEQQGRRFYAPPGQDLPSYSSNEFIWLKVVMPTQYDVSLLNPLVNELSVQTGQEPSLIMNWIQSGPCLAEKVTDVETGVTSVSNTHILVPDMVRGAFEKRNSPQLYNLGSNIQLFRGGDPSTAAEYTVQIAPNYPHKSKTIPQFVATNCFRNPDIYDAILANRTSAGRSK